MIRILPKNSLKEMNDVKTTLDNFNCMFVLITILKTFPCCWSEKIACTQKCLKALIKI